MLLCQILNLFGTCVVPLICFYNNINVRDKEDCKCVDGDEHTKPETSKTTICGGLNGDCLGLPMVRIMIALSL